MVTWKPDTCGCKLELDNTDFSLKRIIRVCPDHTVMADNPLSVVFDENHLKNDTMTALKSVPEITYTDRDGKVRLKEGEVSFHFEGRAPNRTLRVTTKTDISAYEQQIKDEVAAVGSQVDVL